jgi:hypothetical protein
VTWSETIRPGQNIYSECTEGELLNFQNIFDRDCDQIMLEINDTKQKMSSEVYMYNKKCTSNLNEITTPLRSCNFAVFSPFWTTIFMIEVVNLTEVLYVLFMY